MSTSIHKPLIPIRSEKPVSGRFKTPKAWILCSPWSEDQLALTTLAANIKHLGQEARINRDTTAATLLLVRDNRIAHPEGYELHIKQDGIRIISSTAAGAFYGIQTLREKLHLNSRHLTCCVVEDHPTFARRGIFVDCSRGKVPTLSTLKNLVSLIASWKINELQLNIENVFHFAKHPDIGADHSSFTASDILDLQAYCEKYHIRLVPCLASFGHMERVLMLPRYKKLGELPGYHNLPGGTTLNPRHPGSIRLMADLYKEFLPCFKSVDFNVCGDEPWELGKGASKKVADRIGTGKLYLEFMLKLRTLCQKQGKRMNMWADIVMNHPEIIPQIPKDIVMLNWQYDRHYKERRIERTHELSRAGLPVVCCPGTNSWQSHGSRLKQALDVTTYFAKTAVKVKAEGFLQTDWGDAGHRNTLAVALCSFAHGAAHAWHSRGVDDSNHVERFAFHTFGDKSGKLAKAIWTVATSGNNHWAYLSLNESLRAPKPFFHFYGHDMVWMEKNKLPEAICRKRISELSSLRFADDFKAASPFLKLMLQEYDLAAEMDRFAYERLPLAHQLRSQSRPDPKTLRIHLDRLIRLSSHFGSLWNKVNRPSRLCDNQKAFDSGIRELRQILGQS